MTTYSILVVDPQRNESQWIQKLKEQQDMKITIVGKGEEARKKLGSHTYDAVLVHSTLPDVSGIALANYVREGFPDLSLYIVAREAKMDLYLETVKAKISLFPLPLDMGRFRSVLRAKPKPVPEREEEERKETIEEESTKQVREEHPERNNIKQERQVAEEVAVTTKPIERREEIPSAEPEENKQDTKAKSKEREKTSPIPEPAMKVYGPREIGKKRRVRTKPENTTVLVFSLKGGVGKTTTVANLSTIMQTYTNQDVGLVELTQQPGTILSHFSIVESLTVKSWLDDMPSVEEVRSRMHVDGGTELCILPTQDVLGEAEAPTNLTPASAVEVVRLLQSALDVLVIDGGTIMNEVFYALIHEVDYILLISDMDFETLQGNNFTSLLLQQHGIPEEKIIHIVNRAEKGLGITEEEAMGMVQAYDSRVIQYHKDIKKLKTEREPFVLLHPKHPYTDEMLDLAALLLPHIDYIQPEPSFWSKLAPRKLLALLPWAQ
ncbi:response regulator [Aneurinibacillus aneurinilyticus]|uniref:Response regulator receiver domain protein n=1 Tax=Aneurinibacillus aneurinilyticus ATCC 12856 TaxID=649747 RepID=U1WFA4_ANEAE|nr:response regulator [Aneurinibacillus aneurinilyticus]ERI07234.1 response regulator receiver domain protein [Aneurinibacillus aneurinilyticus ATCC 12856]MED0706833.1 response regulator [Aneurinibacillus aneurinilyticus]MED0725908.1 response regulator [Aneurinibacillus aneurinilyticus]MED0730381.1 response regulator [Aneurinibacillus aneurinilyticus]MED0739210.1 response regulator [Aneurinibacillus aneurinilyticus]